MQMQTQSPSTRSIDKTNLTLSCQGNEGLSPNKVELRDGSAFLLTFFTGIIHVNV